MKDERKRRLVSAYIDALIDAEIDRPDADVGFIATMNRVLTEVGTKDTAPDPFVRQESLDKLKAVTVGRYGKRRGGFLLRKRFRRAFAIILSIILLSAILAAAFGFFDPKEIVSAHADQISSWDIGENVEIDGITFIRSGDRIRYDSIGGCMASENLDVYYPGWLPDGIKVEYISLNECNGRRFLVYKFNKNDVRFSVSLSKADDLYSADFGYAEELVGDYTVYWDSVVNENQDHAILFIDGNRYTIVANDKEIIREIINKLEK